MRMATGIAKFPFVRTLEGFDFAAQPSLDPKQIRELATGRFVANGEQAPHDFAHQGRAAGNDRVDAKRHAGAAYRPAIQVQAAQFRHAHCGAVQQLEHRVVAQRRRPVAARPRPARR